MTEVNDDDPFTWDVDRVVKELCTSDRTWRPTANAKLPDPDQLATKLREAEYDGEVLLSSLDHEGDLWPSLAVTALKHKMALRTAIGQFQARSRQYQDYKNSLRYQPDDDIPFKLEYRSGSLASLGGGEALLSTSDNNGQTQTPKEPAAEALHGHTHNLETGGTSEPEPLKKKQRRLAITQLTTVDCLPTQKTLFNTAPILTEADAILASRTDAQSLRSGDVSKTLERHGGQPSNMHEKLLSRPGAFWGNGKLSSDDIVALDAAVDDDKSFGFGQPISLGRGRKKWVNGKMKKFLRESRPSNDDDESVLPVLGESDDEDNPEWEAVYREMEEEEEEVRREKEEVLARTLELKPADVDTCLSNMVDEHIALWQETKLPKLQHKAFGIWQKARRTGSMREIKQLSESLRATKSRLEKLLENLKDNVYSNEHELRRMGPILEPTLDEVEKLKWHIAVVRSSEAPMKAPAGKKSVLASTKKPAASPADGIDIWSDEELDDFIVEDDSEDHGCLEDVARPPSDSPALGVARDADVPSASEAAVSDPTRSFSSVSDVTMYDLTEAGSSSKAPISLDTPVKPKPSHASPLSAGGPNPNKEPPLDAIHDIVEKGIDHWEAASDFQRLIIVIVAKLSEQRRRRVLEAVVFSTVEEVWADYIVEAVKLQPVPLENLSKDVRDKVRRDTATLLARLFDIFNGSGSSSAGQPFDRLQSLTGAAVKRIGKQEHCFSDYFHFLRSLAPHFGITQGDEDDGVLLDAGSDDGEGDLDLTSAQRSARKKKKQKIAQKKSALLREEDNKEAQNKEVRKLLFRQNAQNSTLLPREKTRLIINESKLEGQGLIFVNDHIAPRIKNHQIDGVRFMWDEITKDTKRGCLLAHTMGLGKTMQVITLLTAIAEAAKSDDKTVSCQVPEHLKAMKTLILAPSGIINNWMEELKRWAPNGLLGELYYVEANNPVSTRGNTIRAWGRDGGVLLMGYTIFRALPGKYDDWLQILLNESSLIVGDEAHHLKNQKAALSRLANSFKTRSRIALTGSPLANSVEEYYSMINWISPGFLGDSDEFTLKYGQPIKDGLWKTASAAVRKKAKIRLATLKKVVGPKVHRRTVASMRDSGLPPKKEFLIYLDLGEVQQKVYQVFVQGVRESSYNPMTEKVHVKSVWSLVSTLRLLLAHPNILHTHLQMTREEVSRPTGRESSNSDGGTPDGADPPLSDRPAKVLSSTFDALAIEQAQSAIDASYKMMALDKILEETLRMGDNILIFSQSILSLDFVESKLCREKHRAYQRLDGSTPTAARQRMVNNFNTEKRQVFLISTTAGGVGLNIYGANRVVILDSKYNPLHEQQAIGRAYRMGQTKEVFVYWLLCDGTFERVMQNQQIFKNQLFSQVVDEKNPLPKADPNLRVWFRDYEEPPRKDISNLRGQDPVIDALLGMEKLSGHISSIETTDTFEEEELDANLAADEQLEADKLAAEQTGKALLQMPQQSEEVRQPSVLPASPSPPPVSSPSPPPSPPPSLQVHHPAEVADRGVDFEVGASGVLPPATALRASSEFQDFESTPVFVDPTCHGFPMTHPANTTSQVFLNQFETTSSRPYFPGPGPGVSPGAAPTPFPHGVVPAYRSTGPHGLGPNYAPQPLDVSYGGAAWQQYQQIPEQPLLATTTKTASSTNGTDSRQQQQRQLPSLRVEVNGSASDRTAPTPPTGPNGIANAQAVSTTPAQDAQVLSLLEATRPMMIGNTQERHAQSPSSTAAEARNILKAELSRRVVPFDAHRVEAALQMMEQNVPGELPQRMMWNKLAELVRIYPVCAAALINGRATPEALRMKVEDLARFLLGLAPGEQDPNHASEFLRRSNGRGERAGGTGLQKAADKAAIEATLKKRKEKHPKPIKKEEGRSSRQRSSIGLGSSVTNPFVIDDD